MKALITTYSPVNNSIRKLVAAFQNFSIEPDIICTKFDLLSPSDNTPSETVYDIVINRNLYGIPTSYWNKYISKHTRQLNQEHLKNHTLYDKFTQYITLSTNPNIPLIPTYFSRGIQSYETLCKKFQDSRFIAKPKGGSLGKAVSLITHQDELTEYYNEYLPVEIIFQQYIPIQFDLRIIVLGGNVLGALQRIKGKDSLTTNISQGNEGRKYICSEELERLAIETCNTLKLEYAGVDILLDENNHPKVIEVNQFPHFIGFDQVNESNTALDIVTYLIETSRQYK